MNRPSSSPARNSGVNRQSDSLQTSVEASSAGGSGSGNLTPETTARPGQGARQPIRQSIYSGRSIVPRDSISGQALLAVITIMAFLACLTLGAVLLVRETASGWQNDISREVTVQIRPVSGQVMEQSIRSASQILLAFEGVSRVTALNEADTVKLLEPWLGAGLKLDELPVPRLLTVTLEDEARPDFAAMREKLAAVPGASLDDHRNWVDRLTNMARVTVIAGMVIFALVMAATVLTVVFATRGAMAGNRSIIEVLHFVGADRNYIASQFQGHFLMLGLKGSLAGGIAAMVMFAGMSWWTAVNRATPEASQLNALLGDFSLGIWGFLAILLVALSVAILTAITSRLTVARHVGILETYGGSAKL